MILVTGGAGFIGSNFVLDWIATQSTAIVNLDKLTHAGNLNNLSSLRNSSRHIFVPRFLTTRFTARSDVMTQGFTFHAGV